MPDVTYTTAEYLDARLSELGVDLRTDDDPTGPGSEAIEEVIDWASGRVEFYLGTRYTPAASENNRWVRGVVLDLAVHRLCTRRGNPPPDSVQGYYDEALEMLKAIQAGTAVVPGLARSRSAAPTLSNQRVVLDRYPATRTERPRSTGEAAGYTRRTDEGASGVVR